MPLSLIPGALRERALAKLLPQNALLAALPEDVQARLLPHLGLVDLPAGHQLGESAGRFARAFFPVAGVVSLMQVTDAGNERLAAVAGSEGAAGLPRFMSEASLTRAVVQCAGYGLALGREQLLEEWSRGGMFMRLLMRYSRAVTSQALVLENCRSTHSVEQQLCSLLLLLLDRLPGQELLLAQDDGAHLLGANPEQIGQAVEQLRRAGIASWRRPGVFAVHDRNALRALACVCESRVLSEYHRLLPESDSQAGVSPIAPATAALVPGLARRPRRETLAAGGGPERPHSW